jgi:hypothetical protein
MDVTAELERTVDVWCVNALFKHFQRGAEDVKCNEVKAMMKYECNSS